eukprot:CAMPEP_0114688320 /NCGR_PEP_ID=MMETSP0191-20121206/63349_1 /TAXON_ID=126664 /ORGANISM="Sorites sp." /LENGTH=46 /DNA_ID= /DNA_START= /DNA_END= /DNA_ORIENTATION=
MISNDLKNWLNSDTVTQLKQYIDNNSYLMNDFDYEMNNNNDNNNND